MKPRKLQQKIPCLFITEEMSNDTKYIKQINYCRKYLHPYYSEMDGDIFIAYIYFLSLVPSEPFHTL